MEATRRSSTERDLLRKLAGRIDHADPGAHNNLGVFYYRKAMLEEAASQFELALELDPRMRVAEENLLLVAREGKIYDRRITTARERLRNSPGDVEFRRDLAIAYYRSGRYDRAAEELELLLGQTSNDLPAMMLLARARLLCGTPDRAVEILRRASEKDPDSGVVQLELAQALYNQGMWQGARRRVQRAIDRNPESAEGHTLMAFILGDLGLADAAGVHGRRALQLNPLLGRYDPNLSAGVHGPVSAPSMTRPSHQDRMRAEFELAMTYAQKGYHQEALRRFRRFAPHDTRMARRGVAETMIMAADFENALKTLGELTREFRADAGLLNELGACFYQLGEVGEARRAFREALRYDPAATPVLNNLAVTLIHEGMADSAAEILRNALEQDSRAEVPAINLALLSTRLGEVDEGFELYRKVLARDPRNVEAWIGIGLLLVAIERPVDARHAFLKAVEAAPDNAQAHYNLSFALSQLGEHGEALRTVSRAQELSPYYSPSDYRLVLELKLGGVELPLVPVVGAGDSLVADRAFRVEQGTIDSIFRELEQPSAGRGEESEPLALARDYFDKGLFEPAHAEVTRAIGRGADTAEAHALAAEILTARGLYGEALDRYRSALERSPREEGIRIGEIRSLVAMGSFVAALGKVNDLIGDGVRTCQSYLLLAEASAGAEDVRAAYRALERARECPGDRLSVERMEGAIAFKAGDLLRSGIAYQAIVKIDETDVEAWNALGEIEESQDNLGRSEGCYKRVLEISRGHGGAAIALARLYRGRGEFNAAINVLVDLLINQPSDMEALLALGQALLDAGRDFAALEAFQKVLASDGRNVAARYLSGFALARLRRYGEAITEWGIVTDLEADGQLSTEARKHIEKARELWEPDREGKNGD